MSISKVYIIIVLSLSFAPTLHAKEENGGGNSGDLVGNGGDGQVIEFRNLALETADTMLRMNAGCKNQIPFNIENFKKIVLRAQIESTEESLNLLGKRVEAINYPNLNKIIFNSPSFIKNNNKRQLIVHEFLGLLNVSDQKNNVEYGLSRFLLSLVHDRSCRLFLPKRSWLDKKIIDGTVYFLLRDSGQITSYDLTSGKQATVGSTYEISQLSIWNNDLFYKDSNQICSLLKHTCVSDIQTNFYNFSFIGNKLINVTSDVKNNLSGLNISDYDTNDQYALELDSIDNHYQLKQFLPIGSHAAIGFSSPLSEDIENYYSKGLYLMRFEWSLSNKENSKEYESKLKKTIRQKNKVNSIDYLSVNLVRKKSQFRFSQIRMYTNSTSVPDRIFSTQKGKYIIADDGSVFDVSEDFRKVTELNFSILDVVEYKNFTMVLTNDKIIALDSEWKLQGEYTLPFEAMALAVNQNKLFLIRRDNQDIISAKNFDLRLLMKKRSPCLLDADWVIPSEQDKASLLTIKGTTYYVAKSLNCLFKKDNNNQWSTWIGLNQYDFFVSLPQMGLFWAATTSGSVYAINLETRDETLIAEFSTYMSGMNYSKSKNAIAVTIMDPKMNYATDTYFNRHILFNTDGKIVDDYLMPDLNSFPYR